MTIEYTGRHTTITPELKTQAEAGIQRIDRVTNRCTKAHIILSEEKFRKMAEVTVQCRGDVLVGKAEATSMQSALHDALNKVEQQAIHAKDRFHTVRGHTEKPLSNVIAA